MNKELGEHKSVQNLENLEQLSNEQIDELRLFFTKKTGIHQKADCGGCVKVWAKLYRNHYNAEQVKDIEPEATETVKDIEPAVIEPIVTEPEVTEPIVVEPVKDIKDGKSEGKKDKK